jgi:regulator of protease activity HflC (stomatin/prohibitin superfamily)
VISRVVLDENTTPDYLPECGIKNNDPQALADAMSSKSERERRARVILGTAETEIAEKFAKASEQYINNPGALQLRAMNLIGEGLKEKGAMIVVPSSALDSMNLGVIGGLAALAQQQIKPVAE